jgi:glycosyltransferase involved in cell wall biosynthesis
MTVDVSVIIPTYNRAGLIGRTIESVLAQTVAAAEVIVVDDGSPDDTAAVARRYGTRVRYHRVENPHASNIGPSAARNLGVSLATSPWIAFCDSDDLWLPIKLERQLRIHALCPRVEYSFTDFAYVGPGRWQSPRVFAEAPAGYWERQRRVVEDAIWVYEDSLYERVLRFQPAFPSTLLMSKRRFERLGGYDERFSKGPSEDLEFVLRNVGDPPIGVLAEPVVQIRKHAGNRSIHLRENWLDQVRILEFALATHPAARLCADALMDEIQKRRVCLARDSAPSIERRYGDWRVPIKIAVALLPTPLARLVQRVLVRARRYLAST